MVEDVYHGIGQVSIGVLEQERDLPYLRVGKRGGVGWHAPGGGSLGDQRIELSGSVPGDHGPSLAPELVRCGLAGCIAPWGAVTAGATTGVHAGASLEDVFADAERWARMLGA